jgi:4a-hydroxytetrahydrobiopterin dehydratase
MIPSDKNLTATIRQIVQWRVAEEDGPLEGTPQEDLRHAYITYDF